MSRSPRSYALADLSWPEVRACLAHDRRLLIPVGACDQYGPHLPLGASTLVAEALVRDLSRDFGVLHAPTLAYGVNVRAERPYAGDAGVREKTLHRVVNDLLAAWEDHGFCEFVLITAHDYDPHVEALASVTGTEARVRVVEALGIDFSDFFADPEPQHGGEVLTSLMLYLHPEKVNLALAEDFPLPRERSESRAPRWVERLPAGSPGSVGRPSLASPEIGGRIYEDILQRIRTKVFLAAEEG